MRPGLWDRLRILLFKWFFCFLGGITFGDWLRVLRANHFRISPAYWPRAALLTSSSLLNSLGRWRENRLHGAAIVAQKIHPPLFILGHWRTGTTHLHNLLAVDKQFAFPNNYQVCYPHTFLTSEAVGARFGFMLPDRRPQDNVKLGIADPQEDEFALCVLSFLSPYGGWVFPRRSEHYDRFLTLRDVNGSELETWKTTFVHFLKKLTLKHGRQLLLKSPTHTCRIKLLQELFPEARFVHIHRNPYTVFQSTRSLFKTAIPGNRLQVWPDRNRDERILKTGKLMYEIFFEETQLIPKGRFEEVGFEDLEKDPVGEMRRIYAGLNIPGFDDVEPELCRYLDTLTDYQKNKHADLPGDLRNRVAQEWRQWFAEWDYPLK